jgi:uncharacterized membrane-anchored protein YitT (DUF2179 family)
MKKLGDELMLLKKKLKEYFFVALGSFILAFAINFFLVPLKISTGGVSGFATVIFYVFHIPLSITTLVINIVLFFFGYKTLKKDSVFKTIFGIFALSFFLEITSWIPAYSDDIVVASVFGGILVDFGVGITVLYDGSTGGSDFAALIFHRILPHIPVATFILLIDSAVIILSGIVFKDYTITFYSVISLYISTKVTDYILVRGDVAKSVYIVSKKNEELADEIMTDLQRGVTGIYGKGLYYKEDTMILMCILRSNEVPILLDKLKAKDPDAFAIVSDVKEVRGKGFKTV